MGVLVSETNADVQCRLTTWREGLVVVWKREAAQKAIQHVTVRTDWHRRARFSLATLCMPSAVQVHCLADSRHTVPGRQATPPPTTPYAHLAADLPSLHTHTHPHCQPHPLTTPHSPSAPGRASVFLHALAPVLIATHTHSPPPAPSARLAAPLLLARARTHPTTHTPPHSLPRSLSTHLVAPLVAHDHKQRPLPKLDPILHQRADAGIHLFPAKRSGSGGVYEVFMRWECGCCGCWWVGAAGPPFSTSVRMRCPTLFPARCWRAGGIVH